MTRGVDRATRTTTCPNCGQPDRVAVYPDGLRDCKGCDYRERSEQTGISDY